MNWLSNQILANLIRSGPIRQSEYDNIFLLIHRKSYDTEIRNSGSNSDALSRLSKNSEIPRINGDENVDVLSYKKFAPEKIQNSNSGSWQNRLSQILSQSSDSSESGLNFDQNFKILYKKFSRIGRSKTSSDNS